MESLIEKFSLPEKGVISIIGGGGKTTLMFQLARELADRGERVLTTTTTKILIPSQKQSKHLVVTDDFDELITKSKICLKNSCHVTAARRTIIDQKKLVGFTTLTIDKLSKKNLFQWILIESDGAAHKPLKAPAAHEPVIAKSSTHVIVVIGLEVIGKPLSEQWVFRPQLYSNLTGLALGTPVTEQSVAEVILHEKGLLKDSPPQALQSILLNKAEEKDTYKAGEKVEAYLLKSRRKQFDKILIGSLKKMDF